MAEMGVTRTSFVKAQRNLHRFATILTSAACEWFLILLLLIDGVLSYLATKFARYCDLQLPCILCSRLDHVLGNEKPGFYLNVLCSSHRSELSSLISCHIHGKLADGHNMCEDCLLSFTSKNKSNVDMHRLALGKLGLEGCGLQSSLLNREFARVPMAMVSCSCCNEPKRSKTNFQRLFQLPPPPGNTVTKPNIPLPRRLSRRGSLKKMRDKISGSTTSRQLEKAGFDAMSHVGYSQLNITSDSDSEFPFSDDDDAGSGVRYANDSAVQHASEIPSKTQPNHSAVANLGHPKLPQHSFNLEPSRVDQCTQPDVTKLHNVKYLAPEVTTGHDPTELNWPLTDEKACPSGLPELISLDDIPSPSNAVETPLGFSPQNSNYSVLAELIPLVNISPQSDAAQVPNEASGISGKIDIETVQISKHEEILNSSSQAAEPIIKINHVVNESTSANPTYGDPHLICDSPKEKDAFDHEPTVKKPDGIDEDLKLFLAQNTSPQGIQLLSSNASTNVQGHGDGLQITGSAGLESFDGSSVSDIEGENIVDRLKRQVEYDRKCMNDLYKELEAERSAAGVAANQAMAMITRLQEEKAALHMDALQYLRMMEEQAEYDVDALEKANDLLAEKEKEIQDLEAELEYYKLKFPYELTVDTIPETNFNIEKNVVAESAALSHINASSKTKLLDISEGNGKPEVISLWSELEDEKLYISKHLKDLEKKLHRFTHEGASPNNSDSEDSERAANGGHGEFSGNGNSQRNSQVGENGSLLLKCLSVSNGVHSASEKSNVFCRDRSFGKQNNHMADNGKDNSSQCGESDLVALENEISDLNDRLEALETDFNFLEHSFNSLQSGNKGLQYLQEIAHLLKELRKTVTRSRCQSVP